MKKHLLLAAVAVITFSGCKEEIVDNLDGKWKVTGAKLEPSITYNGTVYSDVYAIMFEACEQDNIYDFYSNSEVGMDEGALKCDPDDPQYVNNKYLVDDHENTLYMYTATDTTTFTHVKMEETTMKGTIENQNFYGEPTSIVITWTKQD